MKFHSRSVEQEQRLSIASDGYESRFWSWLTTDAENEAPEARHWRQRYRTAIDNWAKGRALVDARQIAWGVMQKNWHRQHGRKPDPNRCAGCGENIFGRDSIEIDGVRCHTEGEGDAITVCLIAYAAAWRGAADIGLQALGLIGPPQEPVAVSP